jgi:NAD(P)-dependent dehydrogenase (short-subunit alcohol dehydrogenase family)
VDENKYALITGATSGIGKAAAIQLAEKGYSLLIIARSEDKFKDLRNEIKRNWLIDLQDIRLIRCDLSSLKSIKKAGEQINELDFPISLLINNAGSYYWERTLTEDGFEATFAVCYLSHFLLTNLVLGKLIHASEARIINLASNIHKFFGIDWNNLMSEKKYQSQKVYSNAKTAIVLFTHALSRRLKTTNIRVHSVHPGHVKTNMTTGKASGINKLIMNVMPGYISANQAASYIVNAATNPQYSSQTGLYFEKDKIGRAAKSTYNIELQEKLYKISNEMVGEHFP